MSGPRLGALSNNRWSGVPRWLLKFLSTCFFTRYKVDWGIVPFKLCLTKIIWLVVLWSKVKNRGSTTVAYIWANTGEKKYGGVRASTKSFNDQSNKWAVSGGLLPTGPCHQPQRVSAIHYGETIPARRRQITRSRTYHEQVQVSVDKGPRQWGEGLSRMTITIARPWITGSCVDVDGNRVRGYCTRRATRSG